MGSKIAIITDSSAGFTIEEAKKHNINIIPLHIILNNETDILDTEKEAKNHNFYDVVKTGITKTSQASTGEICEVWDKLLKSHDEIIHYPIAEKLSSQYSSAYMLSQDEKYLGKVHVVRNHTAAYALKRLTIYAQKLAKTGISCEEIIKKTTDYENKIFMAMIPGSLDRLASGGRVGKILLSLISLLKIKILLQWGENPKKIASSRTVSSLIESFIDISKKFTTKFKEKYNLFVLKTSECSPKIWDVLVKNLDNAKIEYQTEELPNVFVAHAGLDTIAFVVLPENEEE